MEEEAYAVPSVPEFSERLVHRLEGLAEEFGENDFLMPVGFFLVIDEENGGNATAAELVRRFELLDFESRKVIDFYFLGWDSTGSGTSLTFNLTAFEQFRMSLKDAGIRTFGGNADLILVDARYNRDEVTLNFKEAIRVDLSTSVVEKDFPTLGAFLQSIIDAAEDVKRNYGTGLGDHGVVYRISDRLGLAISKASVLTYFLEKWGKIIGAKKLAAVTVQDLGPKILLQKLS